MARPQCDTPLGATTMTMMSRFSNFLPTFLLHKLPQNVSSLSVYCGRPFFSPVTTFTPTLLAIECSGPHLRSFAQEREDHDDDDDDDDVNLQNLYSNQRWRI
jgi:hypothetical protein